VHSASSRCDALRTHWVDAMDAAYEGIRALLCDPAPSLAVLAVTQLEELKQR
jgi:hypothetical protein